MKTEESILNVLYENNFMYGKVEKKIMKLTEEKINKLKSNINKKIKDETLLDYIISLIEDFLFDYSEVEEIEKFKCYKTGWIDRDTLQKEITALK